MAPLALFANLATRWSRLHKLQIWPPDDTACISSKVGHQMALVQNLVISWCHLHCFQRWPPDCVTCIASLPWIALLALSVSIELVSSSARVASVKSTQGLSVSHSDGRTSGPKDRTPGLPGSDKDDIDLKMIRWKMKWLRTFSEVKVVSGSKKILKCEFHFFFSSAANQHRHHHHQARP